MTFPRRMIIIFFAMNLGPALSIAQPTTVDGYKGIWFTLGQFYEFGDKYSGGLGTYTAKHKPLAIFAPEAKKTFFVYGGTTSKDEKHLLCMIGCYDHKTRKLYKPVIVHDKNGVDDPHDNPSLLIDKQGYICVFVSGRGRRRMGYKYKSEKPYSIEAFQQISEEEMTYPQPWITDKGHIFNFFTKYTGVRELYFEIFEDGQWSEDKKLSTIKAPGMTRSGHYQVSGRFKNKVGTFFNWHPNGNVDRRTNLYYMESTDLGKIWQDAKGNSLQIPLTELGSSALVQDYYSQSKNVYLKDMNFDKDGRPVCLFITSDGHEPGPKNGLRHWKIAYWTGELWQISTVTTSDHNYDMGSLWIEPKKWTVVCPSQNSPQVYGGGGEIAVWISRDQGMSWSQKKKVTESSARNNNYIRRVHGGKKPFEFFWADGNPEEFSISKLYFGARNGKTWIMPYIMNKPLAKPKLRKAFIE